MTSLPHTPSSTRPDRPTTHFTPETEPLSLRGPSATHHAYSGPGSPLREFPGAYPEPKARRGSFTDPPLSPGFRSSGSMPSRSSESEYNFVGSSIEDIPGENNPETIAVALESVRSRGVGTLSSSPTPTITPRHTPSGGGGGGDALLDDTGTNDWHDYLKRTNPIGLAHEHQTAEPGGKETGTGPGTGPGTGTGARGSPAHAPPRAASLDESSLASDLPLDHGVKPDVQQLSSMASEDGPPFPRGSGEARQQQREPQTGTSSSSYSSHPINIIEGAEGIASDIYHGVEHVIQQVEQKAEEYIHELPMFGDASKIARENVGAASTSDFLHKTEQALHHAEEKAMSYLPSMGIGMGRPSSNKTEARSTLAHLGQRENQDQSNVSPEAKASGPSQEYDLDDEKLYTKKFLFNDFTSADFQQNAAAVVRPAMSVSKAEEPQPSEQPAEGVTTTERKRRDRVSDAARHVYTPSDGTIPPTRGFGEGDLAVGHGGVSFYRFGIESSADGEGVLPGYPTPAGMSKLMSDRMRDDRARAREVGGESSKTTIVDSDPTGQQVNVSPNSRIVQEMLDETKHPRSRFFRGDGGSDVFLPLDVVMTTEVHSEYSSPDATTTDRKLEELPQSPIFKDGQDVAEGKFEAIFDHNQDGPVAPFSGVDPLYAPLQGRAIFEKSQTPVFRHGDVATGKFDAPIFKGSSTLSTEKYEAASHPGEKGRVSKTVHPFAAPVKVESYVSKEPFTLDPSRRPQEKREIPVFKGGGKTAAGRFEAEFVDASRQPQEVREDPEFIRNAFNPQADEGRAREEGRGAYAAPITISVPQHSTLGPNRNPQERSSIPICTGRSKTAAGKYEATYRHPTSGTKDFPEHIEFAGSPPAAANPPDQHQGLLGPNVGQLPGSQQREVDSAFAAPVRQEPQTSSTPSTERHPQEKHEIPIFSGGAEAAAGKYEAGFMDATGEPQEVPETPKFIGKRPGDTASGEFEAKMEPKLGELREGKGKETASRISDNTGGLNPVDYLGNPVSEPVSGETTSNVYRRNEPLRKHIN